MDKKEFKAWITERYGDNQLNPQSVIKHWHSANILSEDSVSVDVLVELLREVFKGEKDANKRTVQKSTKTSNTRRKNVHKAGS